jgi:hypothetical protein
MPVNQVRGPGGKIGYRWGRRGRVYYGAGAQQMAARQGQAAYASGYRGNNSKSNK